MTHRVIIFILLIICMALDGKAQEKKDSLAQQQNDTVNKKADTLIITKENQNIAPIGSFMRGYATSYWTDTKSVFTNPFHWHTGQIIAAAAVTAGTISLIAWGDKPIQQFFYRNQSSFISNSSYYFFSPLGSGLISIPALGVFYACGVIWKNKKAKETGLKGLEAYVITVVFTNVIKQIAHRHRPYQDSPPNPLAWDGPFIWGGDYGFFGYNSFPSGHSSAIFAVATVIGLEYWKTKWVPIVCFGLAGFTALYRLAVNDHWASDVLFGSALGFAIGSLVYFNTNKTIQIIPVSSTGMGATLIYHF
ncbi:MAG: phosphatase PAP2 family protein [Bacteroidales bacterium]|jgi:membrane-associated phospholipid phosphatase|nr:phosphatase PAP2 family protein [Bacteroidales bacterium]